MKAGDILTVDFGEPRPGTPAAIRPAVVVTSDHMLGRGMAAIHVVNCTSAERESDSDIASDWGWIQAHNITIISLTRVVTETGHNVGPVILTQIREVVAIVLDIDT